MDGGGGWVMIFDGWIVVVDDDVVIDIFVDVFEKKYCMVICGKSRVFMRGENY